MFKYFGVLVRGMAGFEMMQERLACIHKSCAVNGYMIEHKSIVDIIVSIEADCSLNFLSWNGVSSNTSRRLLIIPLPGKRSLDPLHSVHSIHGASTSWFRTEIVFALIVSRFCYDLSVLLLRSNSPTQIPSGHLRL